MTTVNEYDFVWSFLALVLSTWGAAAITYSVMNIFVWRIERTIEKRDYKFTVDLKKVAMYYVLFIISLLTFIKVMFSPFVPLA